MTIFHFSSVRSEIFVEQKAKSRKLRRSGIFTANADVDPAAALNLVGRINYIDFAPGGVSQLQIHIGHGTE
jgi:hypothetical protein